MNDDDLRLAPAGASYAACAVCLRMTFNRIAIGDGHVPLCSGFCLQAWPGARAMEAKQPIDEWAGNALRQAVINTSLGAFCFPPGRCPTRCDHDSQCTLPPGHGDRHETEHGCICYDPRDKALNDALSGEADAVRRAESAELGCEIAYKREPTQAEGDAHEYRHDQSMGASECIRECHVPMGNHHGHRCPCGRWVWGGPTVCQRCVDAEAVKAALLRADADAKAEAAWEGLYNERNRLWREEADRVGAVTLLLEQNGCDCDCDHDAESHDSDCERCLACRISWAIET